MPILQMEKRKGSVSIRVCVLNPIRGLGFESRPVWPPSCSEAWNTVEQDLQTPAFQGSGCKRHSGQGEPFLLFPRGMLGWASLVALSSSEITRKALRLAESWVPGILCFSDQLQGSQKTDKCLRNPNSGSHFPS